MNYLLVLGLGVLVGVAAEMRDAKRREEKIP